MIYRIKRLLLIIFFLSVSYISFGEDPPPPPISPHNLYFGDEEPPPPPPCPIEDGIGVVIGVALIYGAFKIFQLRKRLRETESEI